MRKVKCPNCGGMGATVEPILDDGSGPKEYCNWCNGTGMIEKDTEYYRLLGYLSGTKRYKRKIFAMMKLRGKGR